jgi:hypothetical protein
MTGQARPKIINPSRPSECVAALSLSEDGAPHPYMTIFYTVHEGRVRFFGMRVAGTEKVGEGDDASERIVYFGQRGGPRETTNPDEGVVIISGTLRDGRMVIDTPSSDGIFLRDQATATDFIQTIRMVYSMEAQGLTK